MGLICHYKSTGSHVIQDMLRTMSNDMFKEAHRDQGLKQSDLKK